RATRTTSRPAGCSRRRPRRRREGAGLLRGLSVCAPELSSFSSFPSSGLGTRFREAPLRHPARRPRIEGEAKRSFASGRAQGDLGHEKREHEEIGHEEGTVSPWLTPQRFARGRVHGPYPAAAIETEAAARGAAGPGVVLLHGPFRPRPGIHRAGGARPA